MVEEGSEADTDRGEVDEAGGNPVGVSNAPAASGEAPVQLSEAPVQLSEALVQLPEAPVQLSETPVSSSEAPATSGEAPAFLFDLVDFLTRNLVLHPEAVEVKQNSAEHATSFELHVHKEDLGRVIGKQGRTAKSLRTILNAAASRLQHKASLEIIEE